MDEPADFVRRIQDQASQIEEVFHPLDQDSVMGQSLRRVRNSKGAEIRTLVFSTLISNPASRPDAAITFSMRAA